MYLAAPPQLAGRPGCAPARLGTEQALPPAVHDSRHGTLQTVSRGATTDQRYARPRRPSHPPDRERGEVERLRRGFTCRPAFGPPWMPIPVTCCASTPPCCPGGHARSAVITLDAGLQTRVDFRWKRRFHVKRIPLPRSRGAFGPEWGKSATETPGAEGIGRDRWRIAPASGSLGRLSVCRIPASTFNTCTTLLLQKYCSRFSPKEVG